LNVNVDALLCSLISRYFYLFIGVDALVCSQPLFHKFFVIFELL
jgi:hypothetical protein